MILCKIVCC